MLYLVLCSEIKLLLLLHGKRPTRFKSRHDQLCGWGLRPLDEGAEKGSGMIYLRNSLDISVKGVHYVVCT